MNLDSIGDWRRTHYSIDVKPEMDGEEVTLFGWVQEVRDLGALRFIILQDRNYIVSGNNYYSQKMKGGKINEK